MITLSFPGLRGSGFAGNAAIENLQTALNALAQTTSNSALQVNVDGVMGAQTVNATMTAMTTIAGSLDPTVQAMLTVLQVLIATGDENKAKKTVTEHAAAITNGIRGYIAAKVITGRPTVTTTPSILYPGLIHSAVIMSNSATQASQGSTSLIFAFDPKLNAYRLAQPIGVSGRAAYVEIGTSPTKPTAGTEVPLKQFLVALGILPWYETWWGMSAIGVGLVGALGGAFMLMKRKVPKQFQGALGREDSYHRKGYGKYGFRRFSRI